MLCVPFVRSSAHPGAATSPLWLASPEGLPEREPLRHLIIGSPEGGVGEAAPFGSIGHSSVTCA